MQNLSLIFLLILTSCFSPEEKSTKNHLQKLFFSKPYWNHEAEKKSVKKLIIVGTNDFHGSIDGVQEKIEQLPSKKKIPYQVGKSEVFASYMQILRERYPNEVLLLDAGDTFSGTYLSKLSFGQSVIEVYNRLKYDAITIGNHEFDFGDGRFNNVNNGTRDFQKILKDLIATSKAPYIVSNINSEKTKSIIKWPNVYPYLLKKINGINVGVIGTTTLETPSKTIREYVSGLKFTDMEETVLKTSELLREKGANIVILLTHSGTNCHSPQNLDSKLPYMAHKYCEFNKGELASLIKKLPKGTIDAAVAGHTHHFMSYYIHGVPVIQSKNNGRYFGMMEFSFDLNTKKIIPGQTVIHPPTKICHQFFDTTMDCHLRKEGLKFNKLIPAQFLGKKVKEDKTIKLILTPYRDQLSKKNKEIVTHNEKRLLHHKNKPSELGLLTADAIKYVTKSDVALMNAGGIRRDLEEGVITFNDIFNIAPFENYLMTVKVTGKELKNIIRISTSGMKEGIANLAGLNIIISKSKDKEIENDLNQDGKKEDFERNRVIQVTLSNGKKVEDDQIYNLGTHTFLGVSGGDNFDFIFDSIPADKKNINYNLTYRDAIIQYFKEVLNKLSSGYHNDQKSYLDFSKSRLEIRP